MIQHIKEYLKHPFRVGALFPSGKKLAESMVSTIDFNNCRCIVEYGPGTGVFTKEIINKKNEDTLFIAIEQNEEFYHTMEEKYGNLPGVSVILGDAQDILKYISDYKIEKVDYIVSGLPFTSLPVELTNNILIKTKKAIGEDGKFITFQYTMLKRAMFEKYFGIRDRIRVLKNIPPAHVLVMQNKMSQ